jgi:pentatricopeptide repeat protein
MTDWGLNYMPKNKYILYNKQPTILTLNQYLRSLCKQQEITKALSYWKQP